MGGFDWEMSFDTVYRFSVHAVIFNEQGQVLLLKQSYGDNRWGLPGGGVEPGETIYDAVKRECFEELGVPVIIEAFTGLYYHSEFNSQVGIFRCSIEDLRQIKLSAEHTAYKFANVDDLSKVQKIRVENAKNSNANVAVQAF
jgi:8-oxo-dGTP diphosphatase